MLLPPRFTLRIVVLRAALLPLQGGGTRVASQVARPWHLVSGRFWQIDGDAVETTAETDDREGTRGACLEGMVDVEGAMKVDGPESVEDLQNTTCTQWIDRHYPERCASFDRAAWLRAAGHFRARRVHVCIDRFEFPNLRGAYPIVDVSWRESAALCAAEKKRLCTEAEWTFACEGEEASPYPNGYVRDDGVCVIDRPHRDVDERALTPRESHAALVEIDRLWQGEASGARPGCRSTFGVYDLTGNVDEWTSSIRPGERPSILKGGYWGPVRTRCRPSTRAHGEDYSHYQQGFRCCADPDL